MTKGFSFKINHKLSGTLARAGTIETPHGKIFTPAFIAGATNATVKSLTPEQIISTGAQAVLANTYHLMLRPGGDTIKACGGIHKFMNWHGPIVTDSGGFQVFSLGMAYKKGIDLTSHSKKGDPTAAVHSPKQLANVSDEGVSFKSHLDGSNLFLTPELSMELQHKIGADIHMAFDELTSPLASASYIKTAMDRTHSWAERCIPKHQQLNAIHAQQNEPLQALFGVIQGGRNEELRKTSANFLNNLPFDGYGIGGTFEAAELPDVLTWVNTALADTKPRHLLGMGSRPEDLFVGVEYGIDTFDCVAPTRQARNGTLYTYDGRIGIKNARFKLDRLPIDSDCSCYTCTHFTRSYVHHLFNAREILAATLASIHNEYFVINLLSDIRLSIINDSFMTFKTIFLDRYNAGLVS